MIIDEFTKIAQLKEQGKLSEDEFLKLRKDPLKRSKKL